MKINKNYLMMMAGAVWIIAGFFVLKVGVPLFIDILKNKAIHNFIMSIIFSFIIFMCYRWLFSKSIKKNIKRIKNNENIKMEFWKFFDLKSYAIMIFFITFGITIRKFNLFPKWFIGTFYTGLGFGLFLAGVNSIISFFKKEVLK